MAPLPRRACQACHAGDRRTRSRLAREVDVRGRRVVGTDAGPGRAGRRRRPQRCWDCRPGAVSWAVAGGGWPDPRRGRTEAERRVVLSRARHKCKQRGVLHHARVPHRVARRGVCRYRPSALRADGGAARAQPKQLEVEGEVRLAPRDRGAARRRGGAGCGHRLSRPFACSAWPTSLANERMGSKTADTIGSKIQNVYNQPPTLLIAARSVQRRSSLRRLRPRRVGDYTRAGYTPLAPTRERASFTAAPSAAAGAARRCAAASGRRPAAARRGPRLAAGRPPHRSPEGRPAWRRSASGPGRAAVR